MKQRELKFRTWDTEFKEYSEWTNRDPFFSTSDGKIFFWERTKKEDGSYGGDIILQDYGTRFVLQQYTGLKDKNDKEIYEGDIVKGHGFIAKIIWDTEEPSFQVKSVAGGMAFMNFLYMQNFEIIGNIFENPDLLK